MKFRFSLIFLFTLKTLLSQTNLESSPVYVCPPCNNACDTLTFKKPGTCSHCNMNLVHKDEQKANDVNQHKKIAFYLQDGVEVLDFAGPMEVFSYAGFKVFTVSKTRDTITSQGILKIVPDYALSNAPKADILAFFGGNAATAYQDSEVIDWVRNQENIQYYFSVCTGAFILAEAGLLEHKTATTFHSALNQLEKDYPKTRVLRDVRYVDNGKIITTAGISAGIDGALHLVAKTQSFNIAQKVAYDIEYDKWTPGDGLLLTDDNPYGEFKSGIKDRNSFNHSKKTEYETLLDYEGKYEYINNTTLELKASELDTTLYAVINQAKYPLKYIALDNFQDMQGSSIVFNRNGSNKVINYVTDEQTFKLISARVKKMEMYPRRELFNNPDDYQYQKPKELSDGLKTGLLNDEFVNPDPIINMVKETIKGSFPEVHSVLIYKNDKLVLEEYFYGYNRDTPHQLRSASKSFIGGIVGIAVDQGLIKSEKDRILPYFKDKYPKIANLDERKKEQSVEDFLMYRHGLDCEDANSESKGNEIAMMQSRDWVKNTLDLPMVASPGKFSSYCSGCALTLGSLVEITSNEDIETFAKRNLFTPMGISNYDWTFEPNQSSINTFSQMYLTSRDLLKLAKMYKDGGNWEGKQIISESWITKGFSMEQGDYGYLWYRKHFDVHGKRYSSYQASGNGGQKINIWPELNMITVFTGGNYNSYLLFGKKTPPNEMIPEFILQAID